MKEKYLGDSYDLVKRFFCDILRPIAPLYAHQKTLAAPGQRLAGHEPQKQMQRKRDHLNGYGLSAGIPKCRLQPCEISE